MAAGNETEIGGVRLTSPERVLYAGQGITKRELAEYYQRMERWVLPEIRDRPLTLLRCPAGSEKECFVQRRATEAISPLVRRVPVQLAGESGDTEHLAVDSLQGLLSLVQLGVLELHTWGARRDRLDRPDRLVLDLDPAPELPFSAVASAAREVRELLLEIGLVSFVKTTGGKGLHVVAPLARRSEWDQLRATARAIATLLVERAPARYLAHASKADRRGRIFIDYLRNGAGATSIASYSTRARPGAPVSLPIHWEELDDDLDPSVWSLRTVPDRMEALKSDPWQGYHELRQSLSRSVTDALGAAAKETPAENG